MNAYNGRPAARNTSIRRLSVAALLSLWLGAGHHASAAGNCPSPKYTAPIPSSIQNPRMPWNHTDTGAILDGFVGLKDVSGLQYGIDLSSNNVIKDYGRYSRCGAKFAFLRLDDGYRTHATALAREQWTTIPYVFMPILPSMRNAKDYVTLGTNSTALIQKFLKEFGQKGVESADTLPNLLETQGLSGVPHISFSGLSGRIVALDVEEKLTDERTSASARRFYGRFYARAVCSWITRAKVLYPDIQVIIYSTPSVFGDYLNYAYPEDDDCLRGVPVWMARTTADGGDLVRQPGSKDVNDLYSQRACLQPAGNRCIVHQYSHRGVIGSVLPVTDPRTPHVDLNRAFHVKAVRDAKTAQYVRE
ncbi:hypothetical protein [Burkholderia ubonensis]|uniref:hypothetical protein n=1 Tax=Burkholderia ubonensis TaxID=101571 RepID=UPI002AAFF3ED|nr:hypothetical protein [Burkholderia ubonensis]